MLSKGYGDCGEVVNTSGCEPDTREFDSHQSPHIECTRWIPCVRLFLLTRKLYFNEKDKKGLKDELKK